MAKKTKKNGTKEQTQRLISSNDVLGLSNRLRDIFRSESWKDQQRANGMNFGTFSEFCTTNQPNGLGMGQYNHWITAEIAYEIMTGHPDIRKALMPARIASTVPIKKHGSNQHGERGGSITTSSRGTAYLLAKMKRMSLDGNKKAQRALERLASGEITSVNKAAIYCGAKKSADSDKDRCPVKRMQMYWKRANAAERRELLAWLKTSEAKQRKRKSQ